MSERQRENKRKQAGPPAQEPWVYPAGSSLIRPRSCPAFPEDQGGSCGWPPPRRCRMGEGRGRSQQEHIPSDGGLEAGGGGVSLPGEGGSSADALPAHPQTPCGAAWPQKVVLTAPLGWERARPPVGPAWTDLFQCPGRGVPGPCTLSSYN